MLLSFRNRLRWKGTNVKRLATIAMLMLVATGCTVGPNYKRPTVDVPGGFRGAAPSADGAQTGTQSVEKKPEQQPGQSAAQPPQSAASSIGDEKWWEVFHVNNAFKNRNRLFADDCRENSAHTGLSSRQTRFNPLNILLFRRPRQQIA